MKILLNLCWLLLPLVTLSAQQSSNVAMLGQWDDNSLTTSNGVQYNDIWGYAISGREFAIIGARKKVIFLEVTDPDNIVEIAALEAPLGGSTLGSTWRDMKTYGTYAYSVADQNTTSEGLLVFDLSNITGTGANRVTLERQLRDDFVRAHNIFIDEDNGYLYVADPETSDNLIIYDLNDDPGDPAFLTSVNLGGTGAYLHDLYVENNIAYASLLSRGLYVYDMNPVLASPPGVNAQPTELGVLNDYPYSIFNHSSWVSGDIMVFADEKHGTPLRIADISDVSDMQITDDFNSNLLGVADPYRNSSPRGPIAHNPFILGNLCIVSYYHDGVVIYDISDPDNVVNVGHYDTDLASTNYNGYDGCWGTYPFLPSGRILASDVLNGLHVLEFNAALPVEWGSFTARLDGARVRLDWTTTKEEDNAGFTIERERGANQWEVVARVAPNEEQRYRDYDPTPRAGWNTYRIRQTDYDGTVAYSRLATVFRGAETAEWDVYPNPVNADRGVLTISGATSSSGHWRLLNATGQVVFTAVTEGMERPEIRLPALPAGTYWLEDTDSGTVKTVVVE